MWRDGGDAVEHRRVRVILALETSCDDTCAAVVTGGGEIRSNVISSQGIHDRYGGVVPEIASRHHLELIGAVVDDALRRAEIASLDDVDLVAVTRGPGLVAALLVGVATAKALAAAHAAAARRGRPSARPRRRGFLGTEPFEPPFLSLIASGGHTLLARVTDHGAGLRGPRPDARRRRRRGVRQGRAAAGARLSGWPGARAACFATATRRRSSFPTGARMPRARLLLRRPEDGAAVPDPRPRRGRGRAPARRPRRLLPAGDRRVARDPGRAGAGSRPGSSGWRSAAGWPPTAPLRERMRDARTSSSTCRRASSAPTMPR